MSRRYTIRMVEFAGTDEFAQGHGMTWDTVTVEVEDDEEIIQMQATSRPGGFDMEQPIVRAWIATPA